jgi:predicted transposase/invertase (TIGR01784 family)
MNLRNDVVFKAIFGHEKNEKILIALLNAILDLDGEHRIKSLTFMNPFNLKEYLEDKLTILDVKAEDSTGKRYNVEIQVKFDPCFINRVILYNDKFFSSQLKESEHYKDLNKTITISIVNFTQFPYEPDIHNIYRYLNIKTHRELTDLKELHFIELPKFDKDKPKKFRSKLEKWLAVLKFGELYATDMANLPEELAQEEEIVMALQEMIRVSSDDMIREILEMREKARMDEDSRLWHAEQKGIEEGKAKGKVEGKQERNIEIVRNLLNINMPVEQIALVTGLSVEEIQKLM